MRPGVTFPEARAITGQHCPPCNNSYNFILACVQHFVKVMIDWKYCLHDCHQRTVFFCTYMFLLLESGDSLLVRTPDSWFNGCEFESRQEWRENCLLQGQLFVLTHSVSVSPPMVPQWHVKDPGHSAKSAGGRLHLNMHTSLTHQSWSGLTMLLFRQSVGIYTETNSHATHQGTLSHSHLSSLSYCGLILAKRVELVYAS